MEKITNSTQIYGSVLEIFCGTEQGSGFFVSDNIILTAYHVVADFVTGDQVYVKSNDKLIECNVDCFSVEYDICLLSVTSMPTDPLPLENTIMRLRETCEIYGFPYQTNVSTGITLNGKIGQILNNEISDYIVKDLDINPQFNYKGLSGSPVIINGYVTGIVQRQLDDRIAIISINKIKAFLKENGVIYSNGIPEYGTPAGFTNQVNSSKHNTTVLDRLEEALLNTNQWYLLHGSPGSGKSTICAYFTPSSDSLIVAGRYFLKIPNDTEPLALRKSTGFFIEFLENLISTTITGHRLPKEEIKHEQRLERLSSLLSQFSDYYKSKGQVGCLIIDGLDEIPSIEDFLGSLPITLPEGLKIVLSCTSIEILPSAYKSLVTEQSILVTPLEQALCESFIIQELGRELITIDKVQSIARKSEGHPLYLRYLVSFLQNSEDSFFDADLNDWLEQIPVIDGDITKYYNTIWDKFVESPVKLWTVIILSQVRQPLSKDEIFKILPEPFNFELSSNFSSLHFLLYGSEYFDIYHNSFKNYVISKTPTELIKANDLISQYLENNPDSELTANNIIFHFAKSSRKDNAILLCSQDWADRCAKLDVPPELVLADIKDTIRLSIELKQTTGTIRLLLLLQRVEFRYDSVFAENAAQIAFSLISIGNYRASINYILRNGSLMIGDEQALHCLRLYYDYNALEEAEELYEAIERRYRKLFEEAGRSEDGFSLEIFETMIRAHSIAMHTDFKEIFPKCMFINNMLRDWQERAQSEGYDEDLRAIKNVRENSAAWMNAYALRRVQRFIPSKKMSEDMGVALDEGWAGTMARTLLISKHFEHYNSVETDMTEMQSLAVSDLEGLVNLYGYESDDETVVLNALQEFSKDIGLVRKIAGAHIGKKEILLDLREANGVDLSYENVHAFANFWRYKGYLDIQNDYPKPFDGSNRIKNWEPYIKSLIERIGYLEGKYLLSYNSNTDDKKNNEELKNIVQNINFSFEERTFWERSYQLPEQVLPIIYRKSVYMAIRFAPEMVEDILQIVSSRLDKQLGLYSEGFRKVLYEISKSLVKANKHELLEMFLEVWEQHITGTVHNRWERTPELLKIMEIYGLIEETDKATGIFYEMLKTSMGPTWYKEDQLELINSALKLKSDSHLSAKHLKLFAGLLDYASGEMTFQRYVRYEKESFIKSLIENKQIKMALEYFKFEILPPAAQVIENAETDSIDAPTIGNGYTLGARAINEENAILHILENLDVDSAPLLWTIAEIFTLNDDVDRYIHRFVPILAKALQKMASSKSIACKMYLEKAGRIAVKLNEAADTNLLLTSIFDVLPGEYQLYFQELLAAKGIAYNLEPNHNEEAARRTTEDDDPFKRFNSNAKEFNGKSMQRQKLIQEGIDAFKEKKYTIWYSNFSHGSREARNWLKQLFESDTQTISSLETFITDFNEVPWRMVSQLLWFIEKTTSSDQSTELNHIVAEHFEYLIRPTDESYQKYEWIEKIVEGETAPDNLVVEFLIWLINHPADRVSQGAYDGILALCSSEPELTIPILLKDALSNQALSSTEKSSEILLSVATSLQSQLIKAITDIGAEKFQNINHFGVKYCFYKISLILKDFGYEVLEQIIISTFPSISPTFREIDLSEDYLDYIDWEINCLNGLNLLDKKFCETLIQTIEDCVSPLNINDYIKSDTYVSRSFYESTNGATRFEYILKHALNVAINDRVTVKNIEDIREIVSI